MIVRWLAARIFEPKHRSRRIRAHRDLKTLSSAIGRHAKNETLDLKKHVT